MRPWLLVLSAGLVGCTVDNDSPLDRGQHLDDNAFPQAIALTCDREIGLYGMYPGSSEPTHIPLGLTAEGTNICFVLDARDNLQLAHFAANMPRESTAASSFELSLYDTDGNLLRTGWDVDFTANVFANLEYSVPKGQLLPVTMHIEPKDGVTVSDSELTARTIGPFE